MNVTIICDGSYCPDEKVAGYGFWIASSRGKLGGGGVCAPGHVVSNNTVAEMMAMCNSVWKALESGLLRHSDEVLLQTDCIAAIRAFQQLRYNLIEQELNAVKYMQRIEKEWGISFKYRHVKGHSQVEDARSITNRVCDKTAKEYMRIERVRSRVEKLKQRLLTKD